MIENGQGARGSVPLAAPTEDAPSFLVDGLWLGTTCCDAQHKVRKRCVAVVRAPAWGSEIGETRLTVDGRKQRWLSWDWTTAFCCGARLIDAARLANGA